MADVSQWGVAPWGLAPWGSEAFLASDQTVTPDSIPSSAAFGSPTITAAGTVGVGSIASAASFGAPTVTPGAVTVQPDSIATSASFGAPVIAGPVDPGSIESGESWGEPTVFGSTTIQPGSIASAAAWGEPELHGDQNIQVGSISSAVAFGVPVVAGPIVATSIPSAAAWGAPTIKVDQLLEPGSIASAAAWGEPRVAYSSRVFPGSISSAEAWGEPAVTGGPQIIILSGSIWNGPRFGNPTLIGGRQTLQLFIGGINRTRQLRVQTMNFSRQVKGRAEASFRLGRKGFDYKPALGQTVQLTELGETLFAGCINQIDEERYLSTADQFTWDVQAVDKASICDHRVFTGKFLAGTLTGDAIRRIQADSLNGEGISVELIGAGIALDSDLEFSLATVTECFNRLCDITGEHWRVDMQFRLRFESFASAPAAPWGISETSKNWRSFRVSDTLLDYRNVQYVRSSSAVTS